MGKQPYELSVWKDVFVNDSGNLADSYYTDEKVAIIGSDSMESTLKAYNVTLKEQTNGDCTLTFSMLYDYEENGVRKDNPLFNLLKNETKLKLRRGEEYSFIKDGAIDFSELETEDQENRWRDFVIKTIDKDSSTHVANVVAKEIFVNELGKNGWSVTLNTELENNYGTVEQLAEKVLEGSDWKVEKGYSPTEKVQEPLFAYVLTQDTAADAMKNDDRITIEKGQTIYFFYNDVEFIEDENGDGTWQVKAGDAIQILWDGESVLPVDDNRTVVDDTFSFNYKIASAAVEVNVTGYSGNRIQDRTRTIYEPTLDKYVEVYTNGVENYYSYTETKYNVSPLVQNYLTNSTNFTSSAGWKNLNISNEDPTITIYPPIREENGKVIWEDCKNTLVLKGGESYKNSGPANSGLAVIAGETYIVRFSGEWVGETGNHSFKIIDRDTGAVLASTNAATEFESREGDDDYIYCKLITESSSAPKQSLVFVINTDKDYYLYDIQLFGFEEENGQIIFPGDAPVSSIEEKRYFYQVDNEEVTYYNGSNFVPLHEDGYESVRFFETQESNYFNNIQSLAELFEVWVSFNIKHKKNGQLWLEDNKPVKTVKFHQYSPTGEDNYAGFKYGINLKNIKRTVDSNSIASKVIVKANNQEYATDGMCTIARAPSNQSGETEVLNFDYYINQGLLEYNQVLNDLYGTSSTHLRLYPRLKKLNERINEEATLINAYDNTVAELEAQWDLYNAEILSYTNEISELTSYYSNLSNEDEKKLQYANEIARQEILNSVALKNRNNIKDESGEGTLKLYKDLISEAEIKVKELQEEKEKLKLEFYTKYSRFIQEGTWTDESYVDDELYYLDAVKVSNTSAYPQISYTINTLSVEDVDGYEAYKFNVGDRTYIEDTEFFGYVTKEFNGLSARTPYRMEVIVSERNQNLDDASKTTITIKNYKNQFEELFQKITATTQSLQYQVGEYARAASVVTSTGEIKTSTLEQSFQNNSLILSGSDNQNVIWDTGSGIEVIDNKNTNNRVRIVGGGVFISNDAGSTWNNAISGNGINTKYLIAGQIDASKINIVNGSVPYFRWDTNGITAFKVDGTIGNETYDTNKYVRFNQYGIYAVGAGGQGSVNGVSIDGSELDELINSKTTLEEKLKVIEQNASFSLTWKGLNITASGSDRSDWQAVHLDAVEGLKITNGEYTFTQEVLDNLNYNFKRYGTGEGSLYQPGDNFPILSLGQFPNINNEPVYGLRLRNKEGYVTFTTDNRGELWVQDKIFVGPWNNLYINDESTVLTTAGLNAKITSKENYENYLSPIISALGFGITKEEDETEESYNERIESLLPNYSVRIWAGESQDLIENAPFFVLEDGTVKATKAYIKGNIFAENGEISGLLTIGNGANGINGNLQEENIFWAGKTVTDIYEEDESGNINFENKIGTLTNYSFRIDNTGRLYAQNANISGSITAEDGVIKNLLIPDERAGITSEDEEIVLWVHKDKASLEVDGNYDKTLSNFYVTKSGELYASKIFLRDSILIGEKEGYYEAGINHGNTTAFWAGAKNSNYSDAVFSVGVDGAVVAKSLDLVNGTLTSQGAVLNGSLLVKDPTKETYIVIDSKQGISTSNYNSAYGWKIDMNGDAYFSNINARGEIISAVFSYNSVNTMGGDLYLAPTYYDYDNTVVLYDSNNSPQVFAIEVDETTFNRAIWDNGDINILSDFNKVINTTSSLDAIITYTNVKFNLLTIINNVSVEYNNNEGRLYRVTDGEKYYFYIYYKATEKLNIVNKDKISNFSIALTAGCGINLTAGAALGPAVIITDVSKNGEIITQLGRLSGVIDPYFGELTGYGLYGQNAYLTGKVYLPNAGITDEDRVDRNNSQYYNSNLESPVRIWAGTSAEQREQAPFIITQDGSLYATKGVFSGTIQATDSVFSGWLQTTGILIDDNQATYELEDEEIIENRSLILKPSINTDTVKEIINKFYSSTKINILTKNGEIIESENTDALQENDQIIVNNDLIIIISTSINVVGQLAGKGLPNYSLDNFKIYDNSITDNESFISPDILYHYYSTFTTKKYFDLVNLLERYNIDINTFNNLNERVEEVLETGYQEDTRLYHQYIFNIGEDNKSPESVFYVSYDRNNKEVFPDIDDKILQIDKKGLSIWEGGLSIYSDYAAGWRNQLEYKPSGTPEKYYGYEKDANENPYPYVKAIDTENYRLYTTGLNVGKFVQDEINPFIQISQGKISFVQYNNNEDGEFENLESRAFNTEIDWYISDKEGILNIGNKENNDVVTFSKNNEEVILGVKGKLKVDDEIDTLKFLNFVTETDEVVVQIQEYIGATDFDRGINFIV